jgi:SAM-dependent methyltransferase
MFQTWHEVLPRPNLDEFAREEFCGTMRRFFTETLWPGAEEVYRAKAEPAFERRHGHKPRSRREAQEALEETFYYRASNLFGRVAQELLWDTVGETVERQLPDLIARAQPKPEALGSLRLHPEMPLPKYLQSVDIHVMPGNFQTELCPDDVYQAALYDRGVYYFGYGSAGPEGDKLGVAMAAYLREKFPGFRPRRILDAGCGIGFSTLPWKAAFPDAEVHGVDLAAPMLRYAHARAESLGKAIHFSQQNAGQTDFPDNYFDLVTSCLLTHECPVAVNRANFREAHRLLAPGGMLLVDHEGDAELAPEQELFSAWYSNNVNEPFAAGLSRIRFPDVFAECGFPADGLFGAGRMAAAYLNAKSATQAEASGVAIAYAGAIKA